MIATSSFISIPAVHQSGGIVKDDAERMAAARAQLSDAVAELDLVVTAPTPDRPGIPRKDDRVPPVERDHSGPGLHPRPLLGHHELTALEVVARLG
jgi:hypothetical protein